MAAVRVGGLRNISYPPALESTWVDWAEHTLILGEQRDEMPVLPTCLINLLSWPDDLDMIYIYIHYIYTYYIYIHIIYIYYNDLGKNICGLIY